MRRPLPIYVRALGAAWPSLPAAVKRLHDGSCARFRGRVTVTRGQGAAARLLGALLGFPRPGRDLDAELVIDAGDGSELWARRFGGSRFRTRQRLDARGRLVECAGLTTMLFRLTGTAEELRYELEAVSVAAIPLPRRLLPQIEATEREDPATGCVLAQVRICFPPGRPILAYTGSFKT
jgi:hypothetical protein